MGTMSVKIAKIAVRFALLILVAWLGARFGSNRIGNWPSTATPTPAPTATPTPSPTPIYVPQKRLEVSKLFSGMEIHSKLESEPGGYATQERETPDSYSLELSVKVKVPKPNRDMETLSKLNEALPKVLPGLAEMLPEAQVSDKYEALYGRKLAELQHSLPRLDLFLSRHNFFDCETILQLRHPQTGRTVVLLQADMDVDTDGSDPDRLPAVDPADPTFQPITNYHWPKQTPLVNPFLSVYQAKLHALLAELTQAQKTNDIRLSSLREDVSDARYKVEKLKTQSFLLAATDPYVVLPGLMLEGMDPAFQPRVGDYCAVIHGNTIYPAIIGDIGPRDLVGEASLRLGKEINSETTALHRAESNLKVTYLFFPNSADKPFGPPDLPKWQARVEALLNEIGGYGGSLHTWVNLSKPAPTPTPTPSPTPVPTPLPSGSSGTSPSPGTANPVTNPAPSPTISGTGSASPAAPTASGTSIGLPKPPAVTPMSSPKPIAPYLP